MSLKAQISPIDRKWYAVRCKFRCEKQIVADLIDLGVEAYIPIQKKIRQYASRKKTSEVALIHSHVFVRIDQAAYLTVLRHHHVFKFLELGGIISAIPEDEMNLLKRVVGEYDNIDIVDAHYQEGDSVQIIHGELSGLEGTLIEQSNYNFKIQLQSLGMGLMIDVDPRFLIKVGSMKKMVA